MACMAYIKTKIYEHKRTYIYVDYMYMSATRRKHDCARRHTHNFVRIVRNWGVPASPDNKTSLPPSWNYIFIFSVFFSLALVPSLPPFARTPHSRDICTKCDI